ncbi:MAG: imidazole glycerol phosphate synthase subunit HisH [Actinomycetota bacterium]|nr:imidazole glycerol phosphate synthase subunit HisH [Actinomycetota bacterium]
MKVAVLDHGMGNLRSVAKALEAAGATVTVTKRPEDIEASDGLCVPGQGIFGRCMANLAERDLADLVRAWVSDDRPYLGICLGMQVLFSSSEEGGHHEGMGLIEGSVTKLPDTVRVPHIGWNEVSGQYFYFDHSYAAHPTDESIVTGWCEHGESFAAEIRRGSIVGVQFHPEKSARAGIALLEGWVAAA